MKKLIVHMEIEFSDKISTDEDIREVVRNVKNALVNEVENGEGIAPEYSDAFTKRVEVWCDFLACLEEHEF